MSQPPPQPQFQLPPITVEPAGNWTPEQFGIARSNPGFGHAHVVLWEAMNARADKVMLDYTRDGVAQKYSIDGIWVPAGGRDRMSGDAMLVAMKQFAGVNPAERRARQTGAFGFKHNKEKFKVILTTQGVATGERVLIDVKHQKKDAPSLTDLGMREKSLEQVKGWLNRDHGIVLFSAPPDQGLRTTFHGAISATDRFVRDFISIEDAHNREQEVINIDAKTYDSLSGQTAATILRTEMLKEPNVVVLPDLSDTETIKMLVEHAAKEEILLITRIRAKESVEALLRVMMLKPDPAKFAQSVIGVVNQRLIRRLCDCKIPYQPPPQLLQKLGIPPGRVQAFFNPRPPLSPEQIKQLETEKKPIPPPCPVCRANGYNGRIAVYETLEVSDKIRQALVKKPKLEVLRPLAREAGARTFQEEAILQIALGVTSHQEAQRALQQK